MTRYVKGLSPVLNRNLEINKMTDGRVYIEIRDSSNHQLLNIIVDSEEFAEAILTEYEDI